MNGNRSDSDDIRERISGNRNDVVSCIRVLADEQNILRFILDRELLLCSYIDQYLSGVIIIVIIYAEVYI